MPAVDRAPAAIWVLALAGVLAVSLMAGFVPLAPTTFALVALCFACELIDSSVGMGYGTTLTPILLLAGFEPLVLVPTILVSEFLSGFAASFFHSEEGNVDFSRGSVHLRAAAILSLCSIVGVVSGVNLAFALSAVTLTRVIGAVIVVAGISVWLTAGRTFAYRAWKISLLAVVASFNKALSGGGYGPLMTTGQVLSGIESRAAVAITSLAEGFTCVVGASLFLIRGKELHPDLLIPVVVGALASVPLSAHVVRRLPERWIRRAVSLLTIGLGAFTLAKSLGG